MGFLFGLLINNYFLLYCILMLMFSLKVFRSMLRASLNPLYLLALSDMIFSC